MFQKRPLAEMLVENSNSARWVVKRKLIAEGVLIEKCAVCGQEPEWCGQRLVLVLDHINGVPKDNRLINLRLLCPNCNSQTPTFAGRNATHPPPVVYGCLDCNTKLADRRHTRCPDCHHKSRRRCVRPDAEKLHQLLWSMPTVEVARQFKVSDQTVNKWAKKLRVIKPPRGHWQKKDIKTKN